MIPTYTQIIHADFETYWDRQYSLSKMPTINYVRDDRFGFMGCALAIDNGPQFYIASEDEFKEWASGIDWSTTAFSAFNCAFDGTVLTERYGIFPAYYICTKSVAKALLPLDKHNLKTVAPALGLGEKGDALVAGSHAVTQELADYACNDNELSRGIYRMLYPLISKDEQDLIHLTIRQSVEPVLELDIDVLNQVRDDAVREREAAIAASGVPESVLTSNPQFAAHIRSLGLTPPTKLSPATGEETDAFARGDDEFVEFMAALPEHKALWEGRLAAKSNINIRRPEKFLEVAKTGTMPMPLSYCGAHTGRWSGCLVADTEVIVYTPVGSVETKRIVDVMIDDLVWDGDTFVEHDGVSFSGYLEVITYDGVTGTPNHVVFTEDAEISLSEAMRRQEKIKLTRSPSKHDVDVAKRYRTEQQKTRTV